MLVPACRCCCRTTRRARTWKTLQKLSHHRNQCMCLSMYTVSFTILLVTLYKPHVYPPLNPSPGPLYKKKILDKNDENFLVVVMCVVNKLTHLPALPVRSYWLMLCFSLPNFENRICLRFSTTILQIANSYLHAKYLLEWFSLYKKCLLCFVSNFFCRVVAFLILKNEKKKIRTTDPLFVIDKPMWKSSYYLNECCKEMIYKIWYELVPI